MISIAIIGYKGFFGSSLTKVFQNDKKFKLTKIDRKRFSELEKNSISPEIVFNCAMPSKRFWAENNPELDHYETVVKTKEILSKFPKSKLVQISSISAKTQTHKVYGKNKKNAEDLIDKDDNLIIRLGPLYGANLTKGVILDILKNNKVFTSGDSKYGFTNIEWISSVIKKNLDLKGLIELGAKGYLELRNLAKVLRSNSQFLGEKDDQIFDEIFPDTPHAEEVIEFAKKMKF